MEKVFTEADSEARTIRIVILICEKKKGNPGKGGWVAKLVEI